MDDDLEANIKRAMPGTLKMALYAAKKQNFEVLKYTIEGVDSICNNAAMLKDIDDQDHLGALEETTKEFAVLETQIARYKQTLEKMESLIESGDIDPAKIEKMIDESLVEPKLNATKHEFYKRFCERAGVRPSLSTRRLCAMLSVYWRVYILLLLLCDANGRLSWSTTATKRWSSKKARARAARLAP